MTKSHRQTLMSVSIDQWKVSQVIALDWQDGPREGICVLERPACQLYFDTLAEQWLGSRFGDRLYRLHRLADDALQRTLLAFGVPVPPHSPTWAPHGEYASDAEQTRIETAIEAIVGSAEFVGVAVRSPDMLVFSEIWLLPP